MLSSYSYSALGTYQTCPRKFKFEYFEKPEIPKSITADTYMGNAVHRALDVLYRAPLGGAVIPLEEIIRFYRAEWEKPDRKYITVVNEYQTVDDYIEEGRNMLEVYYDKYKPFNLGKTIGTEINVRFRLENTPFNIKAKIDRLWKRNDNVIEICDYKTGRMPQEGVDDRSFYHQMGLYQLAVQAKFPHWEDIELVQYYLKFDEQIRRRLRADELDELKEQIRVTIIETIKAEQLDNFPTRESGLCGYCEYYKLCPAKRHRLVLEEEEGAEGSEKSTFKNAARRVDLFLTKHRRLGELKAEVEALKEDMVRFARDLGINKLTGSEGEVSVKISRSEKFITKTEEPQAFAELTGLVRKIGFEEYFKLDEKALMKEIYQKERLTPELLETFKKYVVVKEDKRVTPHHNKKDDDEKE